MQKSAKKITISTVSFFTNGDELILALSDGNEISAGRIAIDPNNINLANYYNKQEIDSTPMR